MVVPALGIHGPAAMTAARYPLVATALTALVLILAAPAVGSVTTPTGKQAIPDPVAAPTWWEERTAEQRAAIRDATYRGGGNPAAYSAAPETPAGGSLHEAEKNVTRTSGPDVKPGPVARRVADLGHRIRQAAGTFPRLLSLGRVLAWSTPATGVAWVVVGEIAIRFASPDGQPQPQIARVTLTPRPTGYQENSSYAALSEPMWQLQWDSCNFYGCDTARQNLVQLSPSSGCRDFRRTPLQARVSQGVSFGRCRSQVDAETYFFTEDDLRLASGPVSADDVPAGVAVDNYPPVVPVSESFFEASLEQFLESAEATALRRWIHWKLNNPDPGGTAAPDFASPPPPTSEAVPPEDPIDDVVMPDCFGASASQCIAGLRAAGLEGSIDTQLASASGLDWGIPPGAVLTTSPHGGARLSRGDSVIVRTRPTRTQLDTEADARCKSKYDDVGEYDPYAVVQFGATPIRATVRDTFSGVYHNGSRVNAPLRWGEFDPTDADQGWGESHIRARHGWSLAQAARAKSAAATDSSPTATQTTRDRLLYRQTLEPTVSGDECTQYVVIDFDPEVFDPANIDPMGVVTAFVGLKD
jgi:hypothetical protein